MRLFRELAFHSFCQIQLTFWSVISCSIFNYPSLFKSLDNFHSFQVLSPDSRIFCHRSGIGDPQDLVNNLEMSRLLGRKPLIHILLQELSNEVLGQKGGKFVIAKATKKILIGLIRVDRACATHQK